MKLSEIKEKDYKFIQELVSDDSVMKYITNGNIWSDEKIDKFIKFSLDEQRLNNKEREQFHYLINVEDDNIGIISFFKERDNNYHLRVFLSPKFQGQGYFSKSLELIKKRLKSYKNVDKLYVEVHQDNHKMNNIMKSRYYLNTVKYYGKKSVNQYIIFLRYYTYLVKSDYIPEKTIDKFFKLRGNWIKHTEGKYADYIRLDGRHYYDHSNYNYKSIIKNIVNNDKENITVKSKLAKTFYKKPYFPKTFIFEHIEELKNIKEKLISLERPWIFKPDKGFAGEFIQIYKKKDFDKFKTSKKYKKWSIQEYIPNPMLIDNKKFHVRVLFLYRANPNFKENGDSFFFKKMPIYLAKKDFIYDNFEDEEIHISHYSSGQEALYLDGLKFNKSELNKIIINIKLIMSDIADNLKANCFSESKRCYEIFAVDLMITDDFDIKLLEINDKVGFKEFTDDIYPFNNTLIENELELTVDYFLPSKNEIIKNDDFIKIK